jgi:hypothetical protein
MFEPLMLLTTKVMLGVLAIVADALLSVHTPLELVAQLPEPEAPLVQLPATVAPFTAPPLPLRTVMVTEARQLPGTVVLPLPLRSCTWATMTPGAKTTTLDFSFAEGSYVMLVPEIVLTTNVRLGKAEM